MNRCDLLIEPMICSSCDVKCKDYWPLWVVTPILFDNNDKFQMLDIYSTGMSLLTFLEPHCA